MQGNFFMQLFIILALLLYGGKSGAQNLIEEVKPMLETFGGTEVKEALKSAEEISQVLTAVRGLTGGFTEPQAEKEEYFAHTAGATAESASQNSSGFPLAPISNIANRDITYSLSQFVSGVN